MKTLLSYLAGIALVLMLLSGNSAAYGQNGSDSYYTITGVVKDSKTHDKIVFASISVPGTEIGTVSNLDGEFVIKVNKLLNAEYLEISHVSYLNKKFKISESLGGDKTFFIDSQVFTLNEVLIHYEDPKDIVRMALQNIHQNYSDKPNMMKGFYRESIRQRRDYLSISEALVDIFKAPYTNMQDDQVKIFKGRNGSNIKKADTLMVKLQGGPNVSMLLDIVKNTTLSIGLDDLNNYQFELTSVVNIDDKPNYVIAFKPAGIHTDPLYIGKLYINKDNLAITMAEFSLDLKDIQKAADQFIQRKPAGLIFQPMATNYLVRYKEQRGKYYLNYVRIDLKFKCDWKRRLFKNNYTIISEVAITDRSEDKITKFASQDQFRANMVLMNKIESFKDIDYWGGYNIIEPEESIQNALKRFTKNMKE